MAPWVQYVIAFIVFCHGFIYVRIGSVLPGPIKGWRGTSWLLAGAIGGDSLKHVVVLLHVVAGIPILACALAIAFAPMVPGWWRPLGVVGAAIGIAAFAVFWVCRGLGGWGLRRGVPLPSAGSNVSYRQLEREPANPVHFITVHNAGYKFVP